MTFRRLLLNDCEEAERYRATTFAGCLYDLRVHVFQLMILLTDALPAPGRLHARKTELIEALAVRALYGTEGRRRLKPWRPRCFDCGVPIEGCDNDGAWCCGCGNPRAWCECPFDPRPKVRA